MVLLAAAAAGALTVAPAVFSRTVSRQQAEQEKKDAESEAEKETALVVVDTSQPTACAPLSMKNRVIFIAKEPKFQTITVSAAGGSLILGTAGGAFGLTSGIFVGGAVGVVPALLTFGLSIPAGAAIGGGTGLFTGTVVGTGVGAVGGGAAGSVVYRYRAEIENGYITVKTKVLCTVKDTHSKALCTVEDAKTKTVRAVLAKYEFARQSAQGVKLRICTKADQLKSNTRDIITAPKFKTTATYAGGGAVVGGTAGGAAGTVAGGAMGAAVGVIPALFTFGLSIPIGAAIGGGIGLCAGTVTGGSAGAVCGGAVGYKRYKKENPGTMVITTQTPTPREAARTSRVLKQKEELKQKEALKDIIKDQQLLGA
eukprot:gnl/TRDRNA2_/TRDRNA2_84244_c0_seq1.p1 gnl/TRDRNA2_/TRDRNA2_84244_c0~~gnl/TRDRNA2_/TRDRNA2_84244_c0_seq1.p1  ORF type:complete len:390 (-),score=95.27 gnl/TRDRNA2_/TRDRNA2_84244_c0_seq1:451-1557(-)